MVSLELGAVFCVTHASSFVGLEETKDSQDSEYVSKRMRACMSSSGAEFWRQLLFKELPGSFQCSFRLQQCSTFGMFRVRNQNQLASCTPLRPKWLQPTYEGHDPNIREVISPPNLGGSSTQYCSFLVPNTIESLVVGTRNLKYSLGKKGLWSLYLLGIIIG